MKIAISQYVFNASERTITFLENYKLNQFLLINNVSTGHNIFAFNGSSGSISENVLTLDYDTTAMSSTDELLIFIDDGGKTIERIIYESNLAMTEIMRTTQGIKGLLGFPDAFGRIRVNAETAGNMSSLSTLSNITNLGGYPSQMAVLSNLNLPVKMMRGQIQIT